MWRSKITAHPKPTKRYVAFIWFTGIVALGYLIALALINPRYLTLPIIQDPGAFLTFAALALATRLIGVSAKPMAGFGLDTPLYTAAMLCIGPGPTAMVAFVAMALKGLVDWAIRVRSGIRWPLFTSIATWIFSPALTGTIIASIGLAFDARELAYHEVLGLHRAILVYLLMALGMLALQFATVLVSYRLNDVSWADIAKEIRSPTFHGDLLFLPLGFALAIAYRDHHTPTLAALAVSYVTFSYIFRQMSKALEAFTESSQELALSEEVGRTVASTLNVEEVGRRVGIALLNALSEARAIVLTVLDDMQRYRQSYIRAVDRLEKPAILEAVFSDLENKFQLDGSENDWPPEAAAPYEGNIWHCELKTPDVGVIIGYLSVVQPKGVRFSPRDKRIIRGVARQAAVAVENWRLYSLATEDGLTGLYVRRYIESRLCEEFERATRSKGNFSLMMVDVDDLKKINDNHGHAAGDKLLRSVATAMRESLRRMDVPGRWGGDEFAVILPDICLKEGLEVGKRIIDSLKDYSFQVRDQIITPSVSIGIAAFNECCPQNVTNMLALADGALYQVKNSGIKGSVTAACPDMVNKVQLRLES